MAEEHDAREVEKDRATAEELRAQPSVRLQQVDELLRRSSISTGADWLG